jgi:hypothetical protein
MDSPLGCLLGLLFPNQYTKARTAVIDGLWSLLVPAGLVLLGVLAVILAVVATE